MAKKGFIKKALGILRFLVEHWDVIAPLLLEIIKEHKEQDYKP